MTLLWQRVERALGVSAATAVQVRREYRQSVFGHRIGEPESRTFIVPANATVAVQTETQVSRATRDRSQTNYRRRRPLDGQHRERLYFYSRGRHEIPIVRVVPLPWRRFPSRFSNRPNRITRPRH